MPEMMFPKIIVFERKVFKPGVFSENEPSSKHNNERWDKIDEGISRLEEAISEIEIEEHSKRTEPYFGQWLSTIIEHIVPQSVAEQGVGCYLEDYERRYRDACGSWGRAAANWWLVKEALYSLAPIVGAQGKRLIPWVLAALGYKHAADWISKLIGS